MTFDTAPTDPPRLTPAERNRQRRHDAADDGLCATCCKRQPPPNQRTCEVCCGSGTATRGQVDREAAWNVCCQRCGVHRFDCQESSKRERPVRRRL